MSAIGHETRTRPLGVLQNRLVALTVLVVVGLVGVLGLLQHPRARAGVVRNASCVWHRRNLVMSALVVNKTASARTFVLKPAFSFNGKPVLVPGDWAVYVGAHSATAWRWMDTSEAAQAGAQVTACTPSVTLPSSDD